MTLKLAHKQFLNVLHTFERKLCETIKEYTGVQPVFLAEEVNSLSEMKGPWFIQLNFGNSKIEGSILLSGSPQSLKAVCLECVKTNNSTIIIDFLGEVLNIVVGHIAIHPILLETQESINFSTPICYQSHQPLLYFKDFFGCCQKFNWTFHENQIEAAFLIRNRESIKNLFFQKKWNTLSR